MTGECNCACMPVQKPLWPLSSPFLLAFPVFSFVVSILPLISSPFSPDTAFLGFSLFRFLSRVVFTVFCILFCLPVPSCFYFSCHYYDFFPLFVVHLCVRFVFLFQTDAALLLDSRSANANVEWNNKCVYSQCSCHLVYSGPLLKGMTPHWGLIRFQGDCRHPLRGAIYTAVWINNVIWPRHHICCCLAGAQGCVYFQMAAASDWIGWASSLFCCLGIQSNDNLLVKNLSLLLTRTCIQSAELIFSLTCQTNRDSLTTYLEKENQDQCAQNSPIPSTAGSASLP